MAVPSDLNIANLISIHLLEIVSVIGHDSIPARREVDGGLVRGHPALVVIDVEVRPVSTILFKVVRSSLGREDDGS